MTTSVAVAADLASFALILRVEPGDTDERVCAAVDASAAQRPAAVVIDLAAGGRRSPGLLQDLSRRCARHAVPLLVAPLLAAGLVLAGQTAPLHVFPSVAAALGSLPDASRPATDQRTLRLPADESAPARARAVAAEATYSWGLPDLLYPAELVTSELVSNAVLHAATPVDVLVRRSDRGLRIGVRDRSAVAPHAVRHPPSDVRQTRGRGLFLVSATAARWGWLVGTSDKIVWALLERG
jgi:anti-sigma regulatory factor (Ser/Thr protein kinase)